MASNKKSLDPRKFPNDEFSLFSIQAYDEGKPERILGSEIGSSKQILQPNDVLISRIVPHIRRVLVVPESNGLVQIGSSEWIIFRANDFYPEYLRHYLLSDQFNAQFMSTVAGVGGSLLRARPATVARLEIYLPRLKQQKIIASILDKAEEIKEKSGIAYDIHESIARSCFLDMFGDVRINNHNHPTMNLGDFCEIVNGSTPSSKETSYWDGDIPWVSPVTLSKLKEPWLREPTRLITKEGYESCSTTMVEQNSILFTSRAPIGLVAIASIPVCTNQGFKTLTEFNKYATPEYMYQLMKELGESIASRGRGATFSEINKSTIAAIEVPIPPLTEQRLFSSIFKVIYQNRERADLSHLRIISMNDSLTQEMLT